jgi:hypothetical protein
VQTKLKQNNQPPPPPTKKKKTKKNPAWAAEFKTTQQGSAGGSHL